MGCGAAAALEARRRRRCLRHTVPAAPLAPLATRLPRAWPTPSWRAG